MNSRWSTKLLQDTIEIIGYGPIGVCISGRRVIHLRSWGSIQQEGRTYGRSGGDSETIRYPRGVKGRGTSGVGTSGTSPSFWVS